MQRETEFVETPYGSFYGFRGDRTTQQLKEHGAHQRNELAMILSLIEEDDDVVDVGAHIGTFCIPIAKHVKDGGHVFAFEPVSEHTRLLERNIEFNRVSRIITNCCSIVTNIPGRYVAQSRRSNTGWTTFRLEDEGGATDVPCITLDRWWQQQREAGTLKRRICLMKVDVEGMELNVLKSGRQFLETDQPILYVEVARRHMASAGNGVAELDSLLQGLGYHFFLNLGPRNSTDDHFRLGRFTHLVQGGHFFDVLAVQPDDPRYPRDYLGIGPTMRRLTYRRFKAAFNFHELKKSVRRWLGMQARLKRSTAQNLESKTSS